MAMPCGGLSLLPWTQVAKGGREAKGSLESLGYVPVPVGLDLIEPGDQITHQVPPHACLRSSVSPTVACSLACNSMTVQLPRPHLSIDPCLPGALM